MKIKKMIPILFIVLGTLMNSCNVKDPCWDSFKEYTSNPDGRGEIEVVDGEGYDTAILWITRDRSRCGKSSIQGEVEVGTLGKWYAVNEDLEENPLILVYIYELESKEEQFGWIDCRYVSLDLTDSYFGEDEQEQWNLAQRCESVDVDE